MDSNEETERSENKQEKIRDAVKFDRDDAMIRQSASISKDTAVNTLEKMRFNVSARRQTVSYMDVINVEDQLVQAFCEQVLDAARTICAEF